VTATLERPSVPVKNKRPPTTPARAALHVFLILTCLVTLAPLLWAVYASLRTYDDTSVNGYFSIAKSLTFDNFAKAWEIGNLPHFYWNTFLITIPALIITLLLSSMVAFEIGRASGRERVWTIV
jgi:multiple sugar transport system permease protein